MQPINLSDDAHLALKYGVAGIIVSNHGGRQLDSVVAGIEALPEVIEAVAGRCEVYVDGGIRRGTDVLKALALGARAVLLGRPILWGLAVNGEMGVYHVLQLLRAELELSMALAGCPTLESITRSLEESGLAKLGDRRLQQENVQLRKQVLDLQRRVARLEACLANCTCESTSKHLLHQVE